MIVSLGDAIALENKAKAPNDHPITGAVDYANRMRMYRDAQKQKAGLAVQKSQDTREASLQNVINRISFAGLHEKVVPSVQEDVGNYLSQAAQLQHINPMGTYSQREELVNKAMQRAQEGRTQSDVLRHYEAIPVDKLSQIGQQQREVYNSVKDIRDLKEQGLNNITGEGFSANGTPIASVNKFVNLNDEMNKQFRAAGQVITGIEPENWHTDQVNSVYTLEVSKQIAESMWSDPTIRSTFLNNNIDYVKNKFTKEVEGQSGVAKPNQLYKDNEIVQNDLKNKFINDVISYAGTKNKEVLRGVPQESASSITDPLKKLVRTTTETINPNSPVKLEVADAKDGMWKSLQGVVQPQPAKFVATARSNGKQIDALTDIAGKKINFTGYYLDDKGKVIGGKGSEWKQTGIDDNGKPIYAISPEKNIALSDENITNIANVHGFGDKYGGKEGFVKWLNGSGDNKKNNSSTKNESPSTGNKWNKFKRS